MDHMDNMSEDTGHAYDGRGWDSDSEMGHRYGDFDGLGCVHAIFWCAKWGTVIAIVLVLAKLAGLFDTTR